MKAKLIVACLLGVLCLAVLFLAVELPAPWVIYPPQRQPNLQPIVNDIEGHLPQGHPYSDADRITWVHEGTHGINSDLRQLYKHPSFYVLQNNAAVFREPRVSKNSVAALVPESLRGEVYNLYLQRGDWSNATYIFDEWVCYTNGARCRQALGIQERGETLRYASEFSVYALCVPYAMWQNGEKVDEGMRTFIRYNLERVIRLGGAIKLNTPDAEALRSFVRAYLGPDWTRKNLGF